MGALLNFLVNLGGLGVFPLDSHRNSTHVAATNASGALTTVQFRSATLPKYQALGTKYQVLGTKYQVLGTKYQVLGTKYLVLSTKYLVPSTKYLVLSTWY